MRFLSKKEVKALVLYGYSHIKRLEDEGKFPRRVKLGEGRYARVGWVESEVHDWIEAKIAARDKRKR